MASYDSSTIMPTASHDLMRPFVDLFSLCVKYPSETEVDQFLHRELKDLASVVSYYRGAHLIVELDNFQAMEETYGWLLLHRESIDYDCLRIAIDTCLA